MVVPGARLSVVLSEIYVAAPAGHYGLLLGNPEAESPRYELERARNLVLSVPAADANPGPLSDNPDFRAASRLASSANLQAVGVWAALGTTLLILIGFTLKAARQEGGGKGGTDR